MKFLNFLLKKFENRGIYVDVEEKKRIEEKKTSLKEKRKRNLCEGERRRRKKIWRK